MNLLTQGNLVYIEILQNILGIIFKSNLPLKTVLQQENEEIERIFLNFWPEKKKYNNKK